MLPDVQWDQQVETYLTDAFPRGKFAEIKAALTQPPAFGCLRVNTLKISTDVRT
jgi:16S rRNA C967 or C1407 C5-methylase (RsmB/RsmF family)